MNTVFKKNRQYQCAWDRVEVSIILSKLSCVCAHARMNKAEMCYFYTHFRGSCVLNTLEKHAVSIQVFITVPINEMLSILISHSLLIGMHAFFFLTIIYLTLSVTETISHLFSYNSFVQLEKHEFDFYWIYTDHPPV